MLSNVVTENGKELYCPKGGKEPCLHNIMKYYVKKSRGRKPYSQHYPPDSYGRGNPLKPLPALRVIWFLTVFSNVVIGRKFLKNIMGSEGVRWIMLSYGDQDNYSNFTSGNPISKHGKKIYYPKGGRVRDHGA